MSRQAVGIGLALVLLAGFGVARSVHVLGPTGERLSAATSTPSPNFHVPTAGERYAKGSVVATPCPDEGTRPVANTLLHSGPVVDSAYTKPVLRLRSAGELDLRSGHLNLVGGEYLASSDAAKPLDVPPGVYPVTVAEEWDEAWSPDQGSHWAVAAEIRLRKSIPVRWEGIDGGETDGGSLAWFDPAARVRVRAAGYDAVADHMDYYDVTANWDSPCFFVDEADKDTRLGHEALILNTGVDGGYPMMVGYDAAGVPADVVVGGNVDWSVLGLPGTPPSDEPDSAGPVPVPSQR